MPTTLASPRCPTSSLRDRLKPHQPRQYQRAHGRVLSVHDLEQFGRILAGNLSADHRGHFENVTVTGTSPRYRAKHVGMALDEVAKPLAKRKLLKAIRLLMKVADCRRCATTIRPPPSRSRLRGRRAGIAGPTKKSRHIGIKAAAGTEARLVFEFALETASRRGEITRLGLRHIKDGRIRIERTQRQPRCQYSAHARSQGRHRGHAEGGESHVHRRQGRQAHLASMRLPSDLADWATQAGLPA